MTLNKTGVLASTFVAVSKCGTFVCPNPKCSYPNDEDAKFCIICGKSLTDCDLSEVEEKSILESWDEIKAGKAKQYEDVDEYTESLRD